MRDLACQTRGPQGGEGDPLGKLGAEHAASAGLVIRHFSLSLHERNTVGQLGAYCDLNHTLRRLVAKYYWECG
jgi:hypothetical protein